MRQVLYVHPGVAPPETVEVRDVVLRSPQSGEVVVRMHARPINPADLLLLEGRHVYQPELPGPVGIEGAGVVEAVGADVALPVGTRVAVPFGGTWAEQMVMRAADLIRLPDGLDLEQGAMLSVNPFTAAGLLEGLPAGSWFIANAGSSAVARMVLALGRRRGLHGIAVVRSARAADELLAVGASAVLVDGDDLASRARAVAGGPIRRALDAVAGDASTRLFDALDTGGALVVYGLLSSDQVILPANRLVFRDVEVRGFSRLRVLAALPAARRTEIATELAGLMEEGVLETSIEARYPLNDVRAALQAHLNPDRRGKILLVS